MSRAQTFSPLRTDWNSRVKVSEPIASKTVKGFMFFQKNCRTLAIPFSSMDLGERNFRDLASEASVVALEPYSSTVASRSSDSILLALLILV